MGKNERMFRIRDKSNCKLICANNINILGDDAFVPNNSVDLVIIDPPFNSDRKYNVMTSSEAQMEVFNDVWSWSESSMKCLDKVKEWENEGPYNYLTNISDKRGEGKLLSYLSHMALTFRLCRNVMTKKGSIYVHCGEKVSHHLRNLLDCIFGVKNWRNSIPWKRTGGHNNCRRYAPVHDTIHFYTKSDDYIWNQQYVPYSEQEIKEKFNKEDEFGKYGPRQLTGPGVREGDSGNEWEGHNPTPKQRHWAVPSSSCFPNILAAQLPENYDDLSPTKKLYCLDDADLLYWPEEEDSMPKYKKYLSCSKGVPIQDIITHISPVGNKSEKRGYPTQKPEELYELFIKSSSNKDSVVADFFCGSGTTTTVATRLGRKTVSCDVSHYSISMVKKRLKDEFNMLPDRDFEELGIPEVFSDYEHMISMGWERSEIGKKMLQHSKLIIMDQIGNEEITVISTDKTGDDGIDGIIPFDDGVESYKRKNIVVSAKTDKKPKKSYLRALRGKIGEWHEEYGGENVMGIFLSMYDVPSVWYDYVKKWGTYKSSENKEYQRIQIITAKHLCNWEGPDLPYFVSPETPKSEEEREIEEKNKNLYDVFTLKK